MLLNGRISLCNQDISLLLGTHWFLRMNSMWWVIYRSSHKMDLLLEITAIFLYSISFIVKIFYLVAVILEHFLLGFSHCVCFPLCPSFCFCFCFFYPPSVSYINWNVTLPWIHDFCCHDPLGTPHNAHIILMGNKNRLSFLYCLLLALDFHIFSVYNFIIWSQCLSVKIHYIKLLLLILISQQTGFYPDNFGTWFLMLNSRHPSPWLDIHLGVWVRSLKLIF